MHWNLTRLAETLLPLLNEEEGNDEAGMASAHEALAKFSNHFESALNNGFRKKLGLTIQLDEDPALVEDLLTRMADNHADFTLTFRNLCNAAANPEADQSVRTLFDNPSALDTWSIKWRERLAREPLPPAERAEQMRTVNPAYIPRNHMVEAALRAATDNDNFQPFEDLLAVLAHPYNDQPGMEQYAKPARPEEYVHQTFCGT